MNINGSGKPQVGLDYGNLLKLQKEAEDSKKLICDSCLERIRQKNNKVGSIEVNFDTGSPFIWFILLEIRIENFGIYNVCLNVEWKSDSTDSTYCTNTNFHYLGSLSGISCLSSPKDFEKFINDVTEGFYNLVIKMETNYTPNEKIDVSAVNTDEICDDKIEELIKIQNELGISQFIAFENDIVKRKENFEYRDRVLSNRAKEAFIILNNEIIMYKKQQKFLNIIIITLICIMLLNYYYNNIYSNCSSIVH